MHPCAFHISVNVEIMDILRHQALSFRHSALRDIKKALQNAGMPSILEPSGRYDCFRSSKSFLWDAPSTDTFAQTNISCALHAGSAAQQAENAKGLIPVPYETDTTGVFGSSSRTLLADTESKEPKETWWLKQRLRLTVVRGNALVSLPPQNRTKLLCNIS